MDLLRVPHLLAEKQPSWNYSGATVIQRQVWAPFCFGDLRYKIINYTWILQIAELIVIIKREKKRLKNYYWSELLLNQNIIFCSGQGLCSILFCTIPGLIVSDFIKAFTHCQSIFNSNKNSMFLILFIHFSKFSSSQRLHATLSFFINQL